MSKEQTIWYEPHPVSAERKAELRGKGLTIIDAVFMPADCVQGDGSGEALPPIDPADAGEAGDPVKRGRKPGKSADAGEAQ